MAAVNKFGDVQGKGKNGKWNTKQTKVYLDQKNCKMVQ